MSALSDLFQDIADAIRGQTGDTAKMSPAAFPAAIAAIAGGGGTVDILPETALVNTDLGNGLYSLTFTEQFELTAGETYIVEFAGVAYTCEADTATIGTLTGVGIGNPALVGAGSDTGEPFIIGVPTDGSGAQGYTTVSDSPITVRIYQEASGGEETSSVVYARGQLSSGLSTKATITHNLGVVPDLVIVNWANMRSMPTDVQPCLFAFGYSQAFLDAHSGVYGGYLNYNPSNLALVGLPITTPIDGTSGYIHDATATTVVFDPESMGYVMDSNTGYAWTAIGGLT